MVLTRCSFINMSLVWLNHFGTTSASPPPPKKNLENHAPNPPKLGLPHQQVHRFRTVQVFFGGMYFLFTTKKSLALKHLAFSIGHRGVSRLSICWKKKPFLSFRNIGYLKDGILNLPNMIRNGGLEGIVPPILRYALFFSKRLVCR